MSHEIATHQHRHTSRTGRRVRSVARRATAVLALGLAVTGAAASLPSDGLTGSGPLASVAPSTADAATRGNVWINFGAWNCPGGGSVVGVYWAVDNYSSGPPSGDWGDNVIYPSVRVGSGASNTISYTLRCKKWGYTYNGVTSQRALSPYKSGLSYTY